jgi:Zn-dependent membrane protease YugP
MNVLVLMWVGIVLMVYAVFYSIISNQSDSRKKSSAANMFYSDALGTMRMEENVNDDDQSP